MAMTFDRRRSSVARLEIRRREAAETILDHLKELNAFEVCRHSRCEPVAFCLAQLRWSRCSVNSTTRNRISQLLLRQDHGAALCEASLASSVRRHSRCEALRFFSSQVGKGGGPVNSSQCPLPQSFIRPTRAACDIFPAKTNPMATLATLHSHDDVLSRRKIVQSTSIARRAGFSSQGSSKNESGITRMSEVDSIASAEGKDTDQSKQKELAQLEEHLWDVQQSDGLRSLTVLELRHVMRQINRPTAGRKEDLIREVELWVATRHRATIEQQGATRREVASDEESLEEALLKGESQSRQEASSRMTRAPRKGASKRELPQGKDEASPARKSSRIAAQRKETSEDGATGKFERQNKRRKNVEPQDEELEVALPKTRTSTTKSKLEEQVTGNKKNVTTVDDVKAKTPGRGQKAASSKAAGKVDEKKSDESKDIRKKGKIIPVDDEILVPKSDTVKSKNKRKSVTIVEDIVEPKTKVVKGKQSKVKKVAVEEDSEVLNADDGVKRKHKKQTKVKTIVVEENSAASKEPWTMLVHKKLQEGWVAYNPATMRPAPPENGARVTKLMSWNVNGLRALVKSKSALIQEAQLLATLATEEEFDVLCLQETKLQEKDVDQLSQILLSDYDSKFWSCSTSKLGYSGTAVFSKVKPIAVHYGMEFADHDPEGRLITLEFEKFFLLTSYVPNAGEKLVRLTYRTQEWDPALGQYIKTLEKQKPVVLTGDLNCCNEEIDICNPDGNRKSAGFTNEERSSFKANFLNQDLVDTFRHQHPNAVGYTYWGYRTAARPKNQGWRLDYFLVSKSLLEHVHDSYTRPDVLGSDHCPIGLILNLPSA